MTPEKPEFTDEQIAFFRECGRKGGNSRTVTPKSRKASSRVMKKYWKEVKAGKRKHRPMKKPKQVELELPTEKE